MRRKTALILAGGITAFLMVIVIGLAGSAGWFNRQALAAAPANGVVETAAGANTLVANTSDVAALQAQVATYRQQLQQAYQDLQTAYDEIQTLNQQQNAVGDDNSGRRSFRSDDDDHDRFESFRDASFEREDEDD